MDSARRKYRSIRILDNSGTIITGAELNMNGLWLDGFDCFYFNLAFDFLHENSTDKI